LRFWLGPLRRVVALSVAPIYYVHNDRERPVHLELLECEHDGQLLEPKGHRYAQPRRRRCSRCATELNMRAGMLG
jgi:hypothetical protein